MNILIITGGSKGIGKALAEKYASQNYKVYSLARSITDLQNITQISVDLSIIEQLEKTFLRLFDEINNNKISSISLINNAGRLGKISNLENITTKDIFKSIQLNTTTPLILASLFIKLTKRLHVKKQIINISSGAAIKPYAGWSIYCTSKAALDMMTKNIAEEQKEVKNGVLSFGIRPGVVDTEMQNQIRNTKETDFKNLQRFIDLKDKNELFSSEFVANTIYKLDREEKLINGETVDLRDFV